MKRDHFLFSKIKKIETGFRFLNGISVIFLLFATLTACNNLHGKRAPASTVRQSDPYTDTSKGDFTLFTATPDTISPGSVYDMIGDSGSHQFDTYCGGSLGTCMCEYTFDQPGVGIQVVSTPVTYQESDLMRCSNGAPTGLSTFDVRVVVVPATGGTSTGTGTTTSSTTSYASNSVTINLKSDGAFAGSTNYIDLSNAAAYVPVRRFQCRKREFIANPMDTDIIDPFQSGDPAIVYPFNYYTTNVGDSLLSMQQLGNQSWECTLTATEDRSLQWWANPNVFSLSSCTSSFCAGDGQLMAPQATMESLKIPLTNPAATGKRRASFSLSSQAYGVFQVPVMAPVSPINSLSSTVSLIGYAAKPIPNVSGVSSCPSIPIPAKSTWVKLWHYRSTNITPPRYVTTSSSIAAIEGIACNTQSGSPGVFASCDKWNFAALDKSFALNDTMPYVHDASRVTILAGSGGGLSPNACYNVPVFSTSTNADEVWTPSPYGYTFTKPGAIPIYDIPNPTFAGLPFNLYNYLNATGSTWTRCYNTATFDSWIWNTTVGAAPADCLGTAVATSYRGLATPAATPSDALQASDSTPLSTENYNDQLFVVTDAGVDDNRMIHEPGAYPEYRPVTYRSLTDCPGPTNSGCTARPVDWQPIAKGVGAEDSTVDVYPLCVLQFYD